MDWIRNAFDADFCWSGLIYDGKHYEIMYSFTDKDLAYNIKAVTLSEPGTERVNVMELLDNPEFYRLVRNSIFNDRCTDRPQTLPNTGESWARRIKEVEDITGSNLSEHLADTEERSSTISNNMNWLKKACEQVTLKEEQPVGAEDRWKDAWLEKDKKTMKKKADFADEHGIPDFTEDPSLFKTYNILEDGFLVMIPYKDLDAGTISKLQNSTVPPNDAHADADRQVIVIHTVPEQIPDLEVVLSEEGFVRS